MSVTFATSVFSPISTFNLQDVEGFPYTAWMEQQIFYQEMEDWWKGVPLSAVIVDTKTGKTIEKFPIKINPIKGTCHKHAATVMGQGVDSIRFGGLPFQLLPDLKKNEKKKGEVITDAFKILFKDNAFGAAFLTNCINSQYLGGSVIAAKWLPQDTRIEISTPSPKEFIGIPDGTNYWRLREAWIVKEISMSDAIAYGYVRTPYEDEKSKYYYIEHWAKKTYKIMINGKVITFPDSTIKQEGENPFGVVPMVYIPHIRTNGFIGDSIITETIKGVIRELNLRMADIGDAVSDDSHGYVAVRNIRGNIKPITVGDNRPVLDLGGGTGIGNEAQPDMFSIMTKSASETMNKFAEELYKIYRREANHPAVADGEDEGSQRSSLTLAVRMAPLVAEADFERLYFTQGLMEMARFLLIMMADKKLYNITADMIETNFIIQWQPMLPRDREALTTEAAVRSKNKLGSNEHIMGLFGDIQDVEEEMDKIKNEKDILEPVKPLGANPQNTNGTSVKAGDKTNVSKSDTK